VLVYGLDVGGHGDQKRSRSLPTGIVSLTVGIWSSNILKVITLNQCHNEDTNNTSETGNFMIKAGDFHANDLPMQIARFVKVHKEMYDGD